MKISRKPEVWGEKPLDPTIDMLLAAAYIAETKSVGVEPFEIAIAEPKKG